MLPEQSVSQALVNEHRHFKRIAPIAAIMHGQHHHRGITKYFRAKEVAGIKEDLWHVKNHVIKLTNNQKLLFATMIKHQEILANHSLLWVQNQHRWDDLYTPDPASILTKDQKHSSMVQEEVRIFSNTISLAQLGKLNPIQVMTESLQSIIHFVKAATLGLKMVLPVHTTADIFAVPLTYVFNREEQMLYFIVHISLVQPEQIMDMHEYILFLMTMSTSDRHVALPQPRFHNVLAINQGQEYQLLSSTEFQHCLKLANVGYCKGLQFNDALQELKHEVGMISFETKDIFQQVDLDFEKHNTSLVGPNGLHPSSLDWPTV